MEQELEHLWNQVQSAAGVEQKKLFVEYCIKLIELKDQGKLTEEQAAYKIVGGMRFDTLMDAPEIESIIDIATTTELPRITSYAQPIGEWDAKTADQIKQKEWKQLLAAVEYAKSVLK